MLTRFKIGACGLAAGLVLMHGAPSALAATATSSIAVSATVLSFCTITALPLAFGNYSTAVVNASTTVAVACTVGTTYNIGLDVGLGTGATVAQRKMTFNTSEIQSNLSQQGPPVQDSILNHRRAQTAATQIS